ncbi:hypothetical protein PHSY_001642 [Pseudozyma hubeiensis SY62]|uniref:Uncharacterized protein n=1 Tax=Pseudozyma hubeiensis (strain SY62) TaxID=1305764 RepID=R9NZ04_PSEHS|nr:hypothetical protein PHSY_001642 [Pseudozyma hubeiensis SY62]GAC94073.1 hypothetical protein PHSY_001642 [Pseudozyma hubeiensis SY62]
MERNFAFVPPPFLGTSFRQNHQIRSLKSNSYPFLSTHRSLQPSSSHTSPSTALLASRSLLPGFARSNLTSFRRKHLRRCYDLLHLSIQRGEWAVAGKFLKALMAAHEWTDDSLWRIALLILSHSAHDEAEGERGKIAYLQQLDLESSAPFKATATTPNLIRAYIASNRLNDAIELLEQRVNVHPYKAQPELHTMLGMLYLFIGITSLLNTEGSEEGVELRKLDRSTKGRARHCFETALQAKEGWVRGEKGRRQRIWGMRRRDVDGDQAWVSGKRGVVWGRDWEEQDWEKEEHEDLKRVRRRLDGEEVEENEMSDAESSASGSLYSDHPVESSDDDGEEDEEERGRTRSRRTLDSDEEQDPSNEAIGQQKGPKAWSAAWPQVSSFFTPDPPLACHLAEQFLTLLGRPSSSQYASQSTATTRDRDTPRRRRADGTPRSARQCDGGAEEDTQSEASAGVRMDGIQLTREEAEARLRRILFEDAEPGNVDEGLSGSVKRERKREKVIVGGEVDERREKRKRKQERDRAGGSGKRRRREERF